jgi:ABC-type Fe3+-hydroxamate transport system substrate-binding protein
MKKLLTILTIAAVAAGSAYAGCGKTETDKGTVSSIDTEKKQITIQTAEGKTVTRTLTPSSKITAKDGKAAEGSALKGKTVAVVSEHGKVQTVSES